MRLRDAKIAIVCDWLTNIGGAERVVHALHELFPDAPIYTALYNPKKIKGFENANIITSFLQKIPFALGHHQLFLPWMPVAFERFNLNQFDLVISSAHSCAKGIITKPSTIHVCYCHSPMRYVWDNYQNYVRAYRLNTVLKKWGQKILHHIRMWDRLAADRVDHFSTNSEYVKKRIQKYYRAHAKIIPPPVDTENFFMFSGEKKYYLAVGRLTTYKKFDLIVDAFNELGFSLKIVGTGIEEKALKKRAKKNIEFMGVISDEKLAELYAHAKGFIFPQCEDFGITPVEAMASGCPVIAYAEGGSLETIKEGITGMFFYEQTSEAIIRTVRKFEKEYKKFFSEAIRKYAQKFSKEQFKKRIKDYLEELLAK